MSDPRVTVLMNVYNGERYLAEAIDSILTDSYSDFEFVIVDDGSTDTTPQILAEAAARDPRVVLLRNDPNRGIVASANRGLSVARGAYIARLDSDDVSLPGRLARQVAALDADPSIALVSMNYESIDATGTPLGRSHRDHPSSVINYLLHFSNAIGGHSQVMFRASVVRALNGYDPTCAASLDYDLWSRIACVGRIVVLPELGMRYRVHAGNFTTRAKRLQEAVGKRVVHRMLTRHLGRPITEHEAHAVTHAWRPVLPSIDARLADRILRESYRIYRRTEPDRHSRRIVRRETARRLMGTALLLLAKRDVRNGVQHALHALRWNAPMAIRRAVTIVLHALHRR